MVLWELIGITRNVKTSKQNTKILVTIDRVQSIVSLWKEHLSTDLQCGDNLFPKPW